MDKDVEVREYAFERKGLASLAGPFVREYAFGEYAVREYAFRPKAVGRGLEGRKADLRS